MKLEWLIIGGGIHGVHLAARLIGEAGVTAESLRIVDPGDRLLARWRTCTQTTGMRHLRSPSVHHLALDPWALQRFAGNRRERKRGLFKAPYGRPDLALFNAHCEQVVETYGLKDLHIQDRVIGCSVGSDVVSVQLSDGREIAAQQIVLAIGASEQPSWPGWAPRDSERVQHIFAPGFEGWPSAPEEIVVCGGGISAVQVALRLMNEGHQVHVVSRHPVREHLFDSDPGWLGPKNMTCFGHESDPDRRRAIITTARHRGSVPPDVLLPLRRAIAHEDLHWHQGAVEALSVDQDRCTLALNTGVVLKPARVLLATGFASSRPGGAMIDGLIASASLPCAKCGYPVVDADLRWHPRVYVSGPLAELELGPVSRNIAGARRTGDRLVAAVRNGYARARKAS